VVVDGGIANVEERRTLQNRSEESRWSHGFMMMVNRESRVDEYIDKRLK
jgi:hypothetical protein